MGYEKELNFIRAALRSAYEEHGNAAREQKQKRAFDVVTEIDLSIERALTAAIKTAFPKDRVLGEEFSSQTAVQGRMWTLDPIDGTFNMANGSPLFGVQAALIEDGDVAVSAVYLPRFQEEIYAVKGEGAYCNGVRLQVNGGVALQNSLISFGDYAHRNTEEARIQHEAVRTLIPKCGKIRMFGGACMDFSFLAQGRTHATVVMTRNLWDIAPGLLIAREAGARITNLKGQPYRLGDEGVVAAANEELQNLILSALRQTLCMEIGGKLYEFEGCIFDFDGVVLGTEAYYYEAWRRAYASLGVTLTEKEYLPLKSTGRRHILDCAGAKLGRTLTEAEYTAAGKVKDDAVELLFPNISEKDFVAGVREWIETLQNKMIKVAVASSSTTTSGFIKRFGIGSYFEAVLDGNQAFPKKPEPDIFLAAAKKIGADPKKCLVFEDSVAGIEAAARCGMQVIAIGGIQSEKALLCVRDFADMKKYLC